MYGGINGNKYRRTDYIDSRHRVCKYCEVAGLDKRDKIVDDAKRVGKVAAGVASVVYMALNMSGEKISVGAMEDGAKIIKDAASKVVFRK